MAGWFGASLSSPSWLFAAAVLAACNSNPAADRPLRASSRPIMNGTLETDAEGVRVARVTIPSISNGSGALLTNEWILTAGHSTRRFGVKHVEPVASHLVKMGSSASRAAKRIVLHPDFVEHLNKNQDDGHDVALIRTDPYLLDGSFSGYARPVATSTTAQLLGVGTRCYGYGDTVLGQSSTAGVLHYGNFTIQDAAPPQSDFFRVFKNGADQLPIEGDSGGPCVDLFSQMLYGTIKAREDGSNPQWTEVSSVSGYRAWADFVMNTIASVNVTPWGGPTMQRGTLGFYVAPGIGGNWVYATYLANPYDANSITLPWPVIPLAFVPTQTLVAGGDFNGDGVTDFFGLIADAASTLTTYWNGGQTGFEEFTTSAFTLPSGNYESLLGHDFDDDGYDDLLVTDAAGESTIYHGSEVGLVAPVAPISMYQTPGWEDPEVAQPPEGTGGSLTLDPAQDPEAPDPFCSGPICVSGGQSGPGGVIYSRADNPMLNVSYSAEQLDVSYGQWISVGEVENILPGGQPYENKGSWKRRLMPWPWWEGGYSGAVAGFASGVMLGYGDGQSSAHALELNVVRVALPGGQTASAGITKLELEPSTRLVPVRVVVFDDYAGSYTGVTLPDAAMLFDRVPTMLEGSLLNADVESSEQSREGGIWQGAHEINGQFKTFHKGVLLPDDAWFDCGVQFRMVSFDRVLGPGRISRPNAEEASAQVAANYTYVRQNLYSDLPVVMIMADCGKPGFSLYKPVSGLPMEAACLSWDTGRNGVLAFLMGELLKASESGSGGVMEMSEANYTPTQEECDSINWVGVADEAATNYRQGIDEMAEDPNCSDYDALADLESCPSCPYTSGLDSPTYPGNTHTWHGGP